MAGASSHPIRVMLVEDNAAVRRAVAALLTATGDLVVCAEAATVAEAGLLALSVQPDVVVVDLRLPDGSGVEVARNVRSSHPGIRVLLLTSASEEEALVASVLAGASGYLVKQVLGNTLVASVLAVARGESLIEGSAGASALGRLRGIAGTDGDSDLLTLVAEGRTNRQIGEALGLDEVVVGDRVTSLASRFTAGRRLRVRPHRAAVSPLPG